MSRCARQQWLEGTETSGTKVMPPDEAGVGEAACKTVLAGKRRAIGCVAAELGCGQDRWDHRGMMVQNIASFDGR